TDQLNTACSYFKNQDGYAIMGVTGSGAYWEYLYPVWWAQYEGYEAYTKFHEGMLKQSGSWVRGTTGSDVMDSQPGRKYALDVLEQLLSKSKGNYLTSYAPALDFMDAQSQFMTGSGAFMAMGDWFEPEMKAEKDQRIAAGETLPDVHAMRAPIISKIVEKLEYRGSGGQNDYMSDVMLAALVRDVDDGKAAPTDTNVSPDDYAIVREARRINYSLGPDHTAIIPAYSPAREVAKDFLMFMATDKANAIFTAATLGVPLPFKFDMETSAPTLYASLGATAKMVYEFFSNPDSLFAANTLRSEMSFPLVYYGGHNRFAGMSHRRIEYWFTDNPPYTVTGARGIYTIGVNHWTPSKWSTALQNAGLA
ncbi:MAG: hypothetical protein FWE62_07145, partial [Firmicutes bacterium]|nr:hypothetical protein [Bacillota bacterium]